MTDLAEKCLNPQKWHSFRMQSRTFLNSALFRPLINTPLQLLDQDLVPSLPIHPITTCSSLLVLDMMQPILPPLPRGGIYVQLLEPKISMLLKNPMKHTYIMTLTHHQMTSIRYTKPNKASHHLHPYLGFREITPARQPPLQPKNCSKNMMALYMSLQKFISSSAQRLLLPSRNTILRPYNKAAKKRGIHVTDITDHESAPPEDTTHEEQPDPHSFGDTPTNEFDPILDYVNSQQHQEEDMNDVLRAYNVMASPTPNDTPHRSTRSISTYFTMLQKQNKFSMVHLWIGVLMVA